AARVLRAELHGFLLEEKGATLTVHLRGIEASEQRQRAEKVVQEIATHYGFQVRPGREVLELRPNVPIDKGTAVDALVTQYRLQGVLFAGDDVTDLDAMRYLRERRSVGDIDTFLVGVWSEEAPQTLGHLADALVSGVEEFAQFLYAMAQRLSEA
ncbi:MAG: trehalose-phosphatase, partial [Thermomicrobium sp.]